MDTGLKLLTQQISALIAREKLIWILAIKAHRRVLNLLQVFSSFGEAHLDLGYWSVQTRFEFVPGISFFCIIRIVAVAQVK